ncbi:MAG: NADH-quinone oxidoreductase subunit J [Gemmatimonadota bacterium]
MTWTAAGVQLAHFWIFGAIAIASALLFVTRRSPVAAALWLVNTMFCLAALYVLLEAPFVGAVQVLVYAGAIMVVFLFVVMLLNLGRDDARLDLREPGVRGAALLVGLLLAVELVVASRTPAEATAPLPAAEGTNVVAPVARALFTEHLVAVEVTSVLLLAAIVGAVALARRESPASRGPAVPEGPTA